MYCGGTRPLETMKYLCVAYLFLPLFSPLFFHLPKFKPETIKDLLKEFYTSLVDEQIRHDLGEY